MLHGITVWVVIKVWITIQTGQWKQWKLLTGQPSSDGYPTGHIYPPEWPKTDRKNDYTINFDAIPDLNVRLYDIENDPLEDFEISNENKDIVEQMLNMLSAYNSTAVPCRWPKPDPAGLPDQNDGFWKPWINTNHKLQFEPSL